MPKPIALEYDGRAQSISAWARETGLSINLIHQRLRLAWPIKEILTTPSGIRRTNKPFFYKGGRLLEHNGKKQTVSEWAAETGLSPAVIDGRFRVLGWSVVDTLTKPIRPRNPNGAGYKRKNMRGHMPPHKRPGYYPKPKDGLCEKCLNKRELVGDHDPETGCFRGWLCFHCNTGIGKLGDNLSGVQEAVAYLERALIRESHVRE